MAGRGAQTVTKSITINCTRGGQTLVLGPWVLDTTLVSNLRIFLAARGWTINSVTQA